MLKPGEQVFSQELQEMMRSVSRFQEPVTYSGTGRLPSLPAVEGKNDDAMAADKASSKL
jgi:hypothetical protein